VSLRRVDARFLLPREPRSALVLGAMDGWAGGLAAAGVEVAREPGAREPDLAVAPARLARRAVATGAPMIVLEGAVRPRLAGRGLDVRRLLARPGVDAPSLLLPLDDPVVARYAVESFGVVDRRWKLARLAVARELLRRERFPGLRGAVTVAARPGGEPFMLAAARDGVPLPSRLAWLLAPGQGDALSRNVLHLFAAGSPVPGWVLKFARVPGYAEPFERDERGLGLAAGAGGAVAARAPALLARFEHRGIHASVETAAPGERLRERLRRPGRRADKLRLIDAVADWILQVASTTAAGPEALAGERRRLAAETVPPWLGQGARPGLVDELPPVGAVLQHNDLGTWNIVVGEDGFRVLDWESARERGLPLWDLFYFLADALAVVDGSVRGEERHLHTTRLFAGRLPLSSVLFGWTRRAVAAAGVPADAVGRIATLCWLHHSLSPVARGEALGELAPGAAQPVHGTERMAAAWLADPELGESWGSWRLDAPGARSAAASIPGRPG
jgi:hypothetical protein